MLAVLLFAFAAAAIVAACNRVLHRVPLRVALMLGLVCAAYEAPALFTRRVDVPARLAFVAYPWQATGGVAVRANTGIVLTQLVPWTRVARDSILAGEAPLWNPYAASGAPLLANQQTAIFHPFTLLGLLLPIGKAFTLSACLRLFVVALFTFVLLRQWDLGLGASCFGAIAYTFSTFHIVWLLFPLGLASMMLPACLAGVTELVRRFAPGPFAFLVTALSCTVLGGHPESAAWVWVIAAAYAMYACRTLRHERRIGAVAVAFIAAILLTSFFWFPTLRILGETARFQAMQSRGANPADHGLSGEWLLPLLHANILGTPIDGTYRPPRGGQPVVLNDYGEVASGYAGLVTLALAAIAPLLAPRKRPLLFAFGLMLFALLSITEAPLWRDVLRAVPLLGISLHQRLRMAWNLGAVIAAAISLDALAARPRVRLVAAAMLGAAAATASLFATRGSVANPYCLAAIATAILFLLVHRIRPAWTSAAAALLVAADLVFTTFGYNPPARPSQLYPIEGAIQTMLRQPADYRMVAAGWSFLPDIPSYYGLRDVKTTDPVQHARYMRLLRGYLGIGPDSYDLVVQDYSQPFFDFLGIGTIYAPPETATSARFAEVYRGPDGVVLENRAALPRHFFVPHCIVEPDFQRVVGISKAIRDFRTTAIVSATPPQVPAVMAGGDIEVVRQTNNMTELAIDSRGWNLLVTSNVDWPGWRAEWNGVRQRPVAVNGAFVGWFTPPGKARMVLRYRPAEYDVCLAIAAVTFLLLAVALVRWRASGVQE